MRAPRWPRNRTTQCTEMQIMNKTGKNIPVGIDLGTTISVLAYVDSSGQPHTVGDLVPSALFFGDEIVVGKEALQHAMDADAYCDSFKLDMGKSHYSRKIRRCLVPPEVLSAMTLRHLKQQAETELGCEVTDAVITVPAFFDEKRRTATQQAARLAGFNVLDIINEPTAAAVAHGHGQGQLHSAEQDKSQRLLVYDLGGGTFDVTVLEYSARRFTTLATDGDVQLGGRDFDAQLVNRIAAMFLEQHGVDPRGDSQSLQQLWSLARDVKHSLSDEQTRAINFAHLGLRVSDEIARRDFEDDIEPLVERTLQTTADVLREAKVDWDDLDTILLVGGSSRVPLVFSKLGDVAGKGPTLSASPDELIAHGAALYAANRSENSLLDSSARFEVVNVNSHSLGIAGVDAKTRQPFNKIIIPRNTPLPVNKTQTFVTKRDEQPNVRVQLVEGESENPKFCTPVAKCVVHLDPPVPEGTVVEVSCCYEADGTIRTTARVPSTRSSANVEVRRDRSPSTESIDVWTDRLTTGEKEVEQVSVGAAQPLEDRPLPASDEQEEIVTRLDRLYSYVGKLGANSPVPAGLLPSQRALKNALLEESYLERIITKLEKESLRSNDALTRTQAVGLLSQSRLLLRQNEQLKEHSYVVFGRECLGARYHPDGVANKLEEIQQLEQMLG